MCVALVSISEIQDRSQALLSTLGASLLSSFDPHEIVSEATMSACSSALLRVTALARKGFLKGSPSTTKLLADIVSAFSIRSTAVSTSRRLSTTTTYPVVTAVSRILSSILQTFRLICLLVEMIDDGDSLADYKASILFFFLTISTLSCTISHFAS